MGGDLTSNDMFQEPQITLNNAKIKELEDNNKFSGKIEFKKRRKGKCCKSKKVIGIYRNGNLRVLLKS